MANSKTPRRPPATKPASKHTNRPSNTGSVLAGLFLLALVPATVLADVPTLAAAAYFLMSTVTFTAYALDKQFAREGRWRISESTLLGLALFGGWPGALLAQDLLRHKTKKASFRVALWVTVVLNLSLLAVANSHFRFLFNVGRLS